LIGAAFEHRRRAMLGAERQVAAIALQMIGKAGDRPRRHKIPRPPVLHDAGAAGGARGDDGKPARHRLERHIAKGFGDRRVEENVA